MMILEGDTRLNCTDVRRVLAICGITNTVERKLGFEGNFPSTNMFFSCTETGVDDKAIRTEDAVVNWSVGCRCTFVYVISKLETCSAQLRSFLVTLNSVTSAHWVLSFQYESTCAVRDENGMREIREF
jgi:hypothetical protein